MTKAHLSLTGASGKVGLYYDTENSAWYLPVGTAPSTHIVKQSHIRLTPSYDMVSTAVYESQTRSMGFNIGGAYEMSEISRGSFMAAASEAGLSRRIALQRFDRIADAFVPALENAAEELENLGILRAAELKDEILRSGGIANLI